jgi:CheY-like chemotaxis protein
MVRKMEEKRILVVDDESDVCFVLEKVLSKNGFVVDSYENPLLAIEKFKAHSYNLVILDIRMHIHLTIIEINREALREIYPAISLGCFIRKPVTIDYLVKRIM